MSGVPKISGLDSNATRYCANIASVNLSAANKGSVLNFLELHRQCEAATTYILYSESIEPALLPALAARAVVGTHGGTLSFGAAANLALDTYTKTCRYFYKLPATPQTNLDLAAAIRQIVDSSGSLPATAGIDAANLAYLRFRCGAIPQLKPKEAPETVRERNTVEENNHLWETGFIGLAAYGLFQAAKIVGTRVGAGALGGPVGAAAGIALSLGDLWNLISE